MATARLFPAAPLPGEADLLAKVVADLRDDTAKLVYADWLEERDDPHGPFLRAVVTAARAKKLLPDGSAFPKPWRDLCGVTLLEAIPRFHLDYRRDAVLKLARPTVGVTTAKSREAALPVGASKFGGRPDLPPGAEWPTRNGAPLGFVAQFNLADLAGTIAGRDLPPAGVLSFFVFSDPEAGEQAEGADGRRVFYFPDPAALARRDPPKGIAKWHVSPACRLAFVEGLDLPYYDSPWKGELRLGGARARDRAARAEYPGWARSRDAEFGRFLREREYGDLVDVLEGPAHHLLGYARPYVVACDPIPGPDWRHLLPLFSDDNLGWTWGDGDHLFWFVREADLRKRRFDRVEAETG